MHSLGGTLMGEQRAASGFRLTALGVNTPNRAEAAAP